LIHVPSGDADIRKTSFALTNVPSGDADIRKTSFPLTNVPSGDADIRKTSFPLTNVPPGDADVCNASFAFVDRWNSSAGRDAAVFDSTTHLLNRSAPDTKSNGNCAYGNVGGTVDW
jgi:hypothetical protein